MFLDGISSVVLTMAVVEPMIREAGIDKVFWGVTEALHLVDMMNQTDLLEKPGRGTETGTADDQALLREGLGGSGWKASAQARLWLGLAEEDPRFGLRQDDYLEPTLTRFFQGMLKLPRAPACGCCRPGSAGRVPHPGLRRRR